MGRPKLDRTMLQVRVNQQTPDALKQIALELGFQWGADGNTGALLDAIAQIPAKEVKQLIDQTKHREQKNVNLS